MKAVLEHSGFRRYITVPDNIPQKIRVPIFMPLNFFEVLGNNPYSLGDNKTPIWEFERWGYSGKRVLYKFRKEVYDNWR